MTQIAVDTPAACIVLRFADGEACAFPFIWLRDNCPSGFHPHTRERTFDLLSVPADIHPARATIDGDALAIVWAGADHESRFPLAWLRANRPGQPMPDPAAVRPDLWRGELAEADLPRVVAREAMADDRVLLAWLRRVKSVGLGLVDGMDDDADAGLALAGRVGFLRQTNFGRSFEVRSKPEPNNLAYTANALPLHTDLPNQEMPPGFQFLHCLANEAAGGGSVFCDGFAVAEDLRAADPEGFELLASQPIPFRFHDDDYDLRKHDTVIRCARDGALEEIRFNAHIAGVFDLPAAVMSAYYRAYRAYMTASRAPAYHLCLRLRAGQMVVFDNRRILHGREAFDPATGFRHLRGCYVDRGEWDSRIRVLSRRSTTETKAA